MKKVFLIIFLQLFAEYSFCQNINWKKVQIDKFLTVSLPEQFTSSDTFLVRDGKRYDIRLFKATLSSSTLGITVTQTDFNLNPYDSKSSNEGYKGVKDGFRKNAESKGFTVDSKDTIVNDVQGFKAVVYSDNSRTIVSRVCYLFCVNTNNYSIIAVPIDNEIFENAENLERLVRSIRFNKKEILASASVNEISSSPFSNGQKVGEIAGFLLIAAVIIFIIYKFNSKQKQRTYIL
jgi:hypothetical protein